MMPEHFTIEEEYLLYIYDTGSRNSTIEELKMAIPYFDEPEVAEMAEAVIATLTQMSDAEFASLELDPEYEDYDDEEV